MKRILRVVGPLLALTACLLFAVPNALGDGIQLVPGTVVLLSNTGGGGNGGNTSSTTSSTNIFSPASYSDYKRAGGEIIVRGSRIPQPPLIDCTHPFSQQLD